MAEFAYNNMKNVSISYILFELNYDYHPYISYKKNIDLCSKFKLTDDLANNLRQFMIIYWENLQYT